MKKRNSDEWQERKQDAEQCESRIRETASLDGIELIVAVVTSGRTSFPHWRFRFEGRDVLHFWPTSGKARIISGAECGKLDSPDAALAMALQLLGSAAQAGRHLARISRE